MHMLAWYRWGPVPSRDGRPRGRDRWEDGSQAWHGSRRHRPSSRVTGLPNVIGHDPDPIGSTHGRPFVDEIANRVVGTGHVVGG